MSHDLFPPTPQAQCERSSILALCDQKDGGSLFPHSQSMLTFSLREGQPTSIPHPPQFCVTETLFRQVLKSGTLLFHQTPNHRVKDCLHFSLLKRTRFHTWRGKPGRPRASSPTQYPTHRVGISSETSSPSYRFCTEREGGCKHKVVHSSSQGDLVYLEQREGSSSLRIL